jgi:plastocyanin
VLATIVNTGIRYFAQPAHGAQKTRRGALKKTIALGALGAAMGVLVFVSIAMAQSPDSSEQAVPDQRTTTVNITNHAFDPEQLNVAADTTVTWTNEDAEAHTVTADDGLFDSGVLEPGQSYSTWLGGSGTVAYHCELHPDMQGSVVVGKASVGETTGGETTTENPESNPPNQATSVY